MPSISKQLDSFIDHLRDERRLSGQTVKAYRRDLDRLLDFMQQHQVDSFSALSADHLRALSSRDYRRGLSGRSIARYLSAIRTLFSYFQREGWCTENPARSVKAPKARRKLPQTLDPDEMSRLLDIEDPAPISVRDRAIMELFYSSGLRLNELATVTWADLDARQAVVRVLGKGGRQRECPVGRHALAALDNWKAIWNTLGCDGHNQLFVTLRGRPLSVRAIQSRIQLWGRKQGLWKGVHPHMFRHSFASHLLESSGQLRAVQELLGHANISTTQIYTHLDYQHLARVYDDAHPRARRRKTEDD